MQATHPRTGKPVEIPPDLVTRCPPASEAVANASDELRRRRWRKVPGRNLDRPDAAHRGTGLSGLNSITSPLAFEQELWRRL